MTVGEIIRAVESNNRRVKAEAKERAAYDYILANLIAKGVGIAFGGKGNFPTIHEVYSGVFEDEIKAKEEELEQSKIELSALRFKQFAQSYNKRFENKEVQAKNE